MRSLLPNPFLLSIGITILAYMLFWGVKLLLSTRLSKHLGERMRSWDEIFAHTMSKTSHLFLFGSAAYVGFKFFPHVKKFNLYADRTYFVLAMYQGGLWLFYITDRLILRFFNKRSKRNRAAASSISLIQFCARLLLFSVILLLTLSNLGIKVTTLIAGFGVGGIAVALALQKILGDLFSSLSIVLDKPFEVGDFIVVDQYLGEVEKIGLKTTRIRSLGGEQIIFSNSDLLATRIRNFRRMHERRILFTLSLPLETQANELKTAKSLVTSIVKRRSMTRFERCHFMRIGNTVDIETVYWVLSDDYDLYMDIHEEILLEIKTAFASEGLLFAYPKQMVQVLPTEIHLKNPEFPKGHGDKPVDSIIS